MGLANEEVKKYENHGKPASRTSIIPGKGGGGAGVSSYLLRGTST
jgi:hypothetical protein